MIQANCRTHLTSNDFQFLVETLGRKSADASYLQELLRDPSSLDALLDHDAVFEAILQRATCLNISSHLYFYVIARHVLRNAGIDDRSVADYLAEMLAEFSVTARVHSIPIQADRQFEYISDLLAVISEASREETFIVRAHIGNYTLFLTGVFPQRLEHRTRYKGAPDLKFYESVGSQNFRILSDHALARKNHLQDVFDCLGGQFHNIRLAMNDMAERFLHIDGSDIRLDIGMKLLPSGSQ